MAKYIINIIAIILLFGCNSNQKNDTQTSTNAELTQNDTHVHIEGDDHNHEEEEDHIHTEGDDHDHEEGDDHDHETNIVESEDDHSDAIIFTKDQAKIAGLEIYTIEPSVFNSVIKTSGQIAAAQGDEATIVATSNGIISFSNQSIALGASINKGATIVTISAKNLSEGDPIAKVKITYESALKEYNRAKNLVKDRIISTKEFDQISSRYKTAKSSYDAQASNVTATGIVVKSPISGYITSRLINSGDYVSIGQPIVTVSQNRRLELIADVPESQFAEVKSINSANFVTPYNNKVYKLSDLNGRLLSFGRSSNKTSFYIPITFEFNNIGDVIPGSFVEVYLLSTPQNGVISIPISALTEEQGIYFVYIQICEEEYEKREVKLGQSNGERFSILSGLHEGDRIVSKGAYQVKLAANSSVIPEGHTH